MSNRLTIRIGAAHDEVVIDGHTFDRSGLNRHQRNAMTSLIVEALFPNQPSRPHRRSKANGKPQRRPRPTRQRAAH